MSVSAPLGVVKQSGFGREGDRAGIEEFVHHKMSTSSREGIAVKAALITKTNSPFEVHDIDIDRPLGNEVLIDVKGSGLCHSDLHIARNDYGIPLPLLQGHETAGIVTALGPDVRSLKVGDHVVACNVGVCGHCDRCLDGRPNGCRNKGNVDRQPDQGSRVTWEGQPVTTLGGMSGFAEQALFPEHLLAVVSKDIPFDRAALLGCGVVTGAGAVIRTAGVRFGDTVAVFGAGGVGLNAVQAAALSGASKVIVVDLQSGKLDLARKFGATHTVNPADGDTVEQVRALTDGRGVDHAFEVIGLVPTLQQATQVLDHNGTAYVVGMQRPGATLSINVDPMDLDSLLRREQSVRGVMMGSTNFKLDIPLYAELYLQGRLNLDDLVSNTIDLVDINEGYAELEKGKVARSVITF